MRHNASKLHDAEAVSQTNRYYIVVIYNDIPPIMDNQMGSNMDDEMETGHIGQK